MFAMKRVVLLALPVVLLSIIYRAIIPPPPRSCSTAGVPSQTPKIKLRDGRNLVYKEYGVPKNIAKYNVIYVHSFGGSKFEASLIIPVCIYLNYFECVWYDRSHLRFKKKSEKETIELH